ncbi:hypothetical protein ACJJID_00230 (plasmid) [Microbulbifer sp. CnH-101-G]|uniref:hypothetical protein n=1 Tax=Microbulbifer sp. CnH-101-G TaxID=3243393 RepID=UPI00403A3331
MQLVIAKGCVANEAPRKRGDTIEVNDKNKSCLQVLLAGGLAVKAGTEEAKEILQAVAAEEKATKADDKTSK